MVKQIEDEAGVQTPPFARLNTHVHAVKYNTSSFVGIAGLSGCTPSVG